MYVLGIDIGGTFTDLVAVDESGTVTFVKTASTPEDQSSGVLAGLDLMAEHLGIGLADLLARTDRIVHGMTVATNALLERKGAKVALLTTEGHRDVLEMREGLKPERYNLRLARPEPLVPRHLRLGVRQRLRADGGVEVPLDPASLTEALEVCEREQVDAVAVCYLHAYRDASHERATRDAITETLPDVYVSLSSDVLPQIKEYERVSTTVVNAYVGPLIRTYLTHLDSRLRDAGYNGPVLVVLSHGGVAPIAEAIRVAAGTVLSGPAGGVAGARHVASLRDYRTSFRSTWAARRPTSRLWSAAKRPLLPTAASPRRRSRFRASTSSRSARAAARLHGATRAGCSRWDRKAPARDPGPCSLWPRRN